VLGANIGSAALAWFALSGEDAASKRVPAGNGVFKFAGAAIAAASSPWTLPWIAQALSQVGTPAQQVVVAHLSFNLVLAALGLPLVGIVARWMEKWLPVADAADARGRPTYLEESALATPSLALSCASREALHQADVVETMLQGLMPVIRDGNEEAAQKLRALDDRVDASYSAIKAYLTKISREALNEREGRRWTDVMSFTINLEQIGDIVERVIQDIEDRKIRPQRSFSSDGLREIEHLHARLLENLRLAMSVFLESHVREAQMLLEAKAAFRDLERQYGRNHLERLQKGGTDSIETSSLHIDLLSDLKRINSHICALAYPVLESAGALAQTRLRGR
jgi:phosphate:Na+ symporter